jgi:hypothetical protein
MGDKGSTRRKEISVHKERMGKRSQVISGRNDEVSVKLRGNARSSHISQPAARLRDNCRNAFLFPRGINRSWMATVPTGEIEKAPLAIPP